LLAAKLIAAQGLEVVAMNFQIPFYTSSAASVSSRIKANLGSNLETIDISSELLRLLENPRYGFGSNINPCIDCKILMLTKTRQLLGKYDAKFVITGEVLGQRPMSQNRPALKLIEKRSGLEGLLLRPLSAKLLEETLPEKQGWVNREKLHNFSGRSRKPQIQLAKELNICDYPNPAGGCLLTDPNFSERVKDLLKYSCLTLDNIVLLRIGRHFRLSEAAKLIVGRNEKENEELLSLSEDGDTIFSPDNIAGPSALGRGIFDEKLSQLACEIVCRYCDNNETKATQICYFRKPDADSKFVVAHPAEQQLLQAIRI